MPAFGSFASLGTSSQPAFCAASTSFKFGQKQGFGSSASLGKSSRPAFGAASTSSPGAIHTALGTTNTLSCGSTLALPFGITGAALGVSHAPAFGSAEALQTSSATGFSSSSIPVFGAFSGIPLGAARTSIFGASSASVCYCGSTLALGQSTSALGNASPLGTWSYPFGAETSQAFEATKAGNGQHAAGNRVLDDTTTFDGYVCTHPAEKLPSYIDKGPEELRSTQSYWSIAGGIGFGASNFGFSSLGASSTPLFSSSPNVASLSTDHTQTTLTTVPAFQPVSGHHFLAHSVHPNLGHHPQLSVIPRLWELFRCWAVQRILPTFLHRHSGPPFHPHLSRQILLLNRLLHQGRNFDQSIIACTLAPPTGVGQNMFSRTLQLHSPDNPVGFGQAVPSFSSPSPSRRFLFSRELKADNSGFKWLPEHFGFSWSECIQPTFISANLHNVFATTSYDLVHLGSLMQVLKMESKQ